jgi:tetratricopeptide (TPR) repeat protein
MGAHAAPYMDSRGVLHNLKPIARLAVSGPDVEPRLGDSEFGSLWFVAKEDDADDGLPTRARVRRGDDDASVVIDLDVTGLMAGTKQNAGGTEPGAGEEQQGQERQKAEDARTEKADPALPLIPGPEPVLAREAPKAAREKSRPALTAADLEAIRWRLDGGTLREVVDDKDALRELGEKLDEPLADEADTVAKAGLLSVRAEVYRLLGELGMAAAASRLALAHAESARDTQSMVIAQAELAHVLRLRGDFGEADRLFGKAASAPVPEPLRSVVHENAGRCCFDQGRYMEALDHFARAVRLGRPDDTELAERIGVCLEAVYIHVLRDGWGPYPRMEALQEATAEQPTLR